MRAKLGFLSKSGSIKVFKTTAEGLELLIDLDGGGSATIVFSWSEVAGVASAAKELVVSDEGPKVA